MLIELKLMIIHYDTFPLRNVNNTIGNTWLKLKWSNLNGFSSRILFHSVVRKTWWKVTSIKSFAFCRNLRVTDIRNSCLRQSVGDQFREKSRVLHKDSFARFPNKNEKKPLMKTHCNCNANANRIWMQSTISSQTYSIFPFIGSAGFFYMPFHFND